MSLLKFKFPKTFSLSVNEKHVSTSTKSIKFLEEVTIPYLYGTRANLTLLLDQPALLVFDAFRVEITNKVIDLLDENKIFVCKVPPKMTNLVQPQDFMLNKSAKDFTKQKFVNQFQDELIKVWERRQNLDDIEIQYQLSVLKALCDRWLIDLYNYMTTEVGKQIMNGWRRPRILDTIHLGWQNLPPVDRFNDISSMSNESTFSGINRFDLHPA